MLVEILELLKNSQGKVPEDLLYKLAEQKIKEMMEDLLGDVIHHEFNDFLGFRKNEQGAAQAAGNSRNGSYQRKLNTRIGELNINLPRDRNADFSTKMFDKNQRNLSNLDEAVKLLYASGMSGHDIETAISKLYKNNLSQGSISNITKSFQEDVKEFNSRKLADKYFAIFVDATYLSLKRKTFDKEAVNTVIGIRLDGVCEILEFSVSPTETKSEWERIFLNLHNRGIDSCQILISDGFTGIEELSKKYFGESCKYQRCCIHLIRNLKNMVRESDQDEIASDFSDTLHMQDKEHANSAFDCFVNKWSIKYPSIKTWAERTPKQTIYAFMDFPRKLRKLIYTNNRIENLNAIIKRKARKHIQFPSQDSLERFVVSSYMSYNNSQKERHIQNYTLISK